MANPFPGIPKALLDRLEELFPDALPPDLVGAEQTARLIGQQDVVRKLRTEYARQLEPKT